uniref:Uncharacterized protein n=1 Tax=Anguilla anguilla TaxID=7936 RepID=A0A0E9WI48_ANGAN
MRQKVESRGLCCDNFMHQTFINHTGTLKNTSRLISYTFFNTIFAKMKTRSFIYTCLKMQ